MLGTRRVELVEEADLQARVLRRRRSTFSSEMHLRRSGVRTAAVPSLEEPLPTSTSRLSIAPSSEPSGKHLGGPLLTWPHTKCVEPQTPPARRWRRSSQ